MADKRIKGITIEIDGNTKKLGDALKDVNKQISQSNAELKDLRSALKLDPKNTELLAQKQEVLAKQIKDTTERLNTLKQAQKDLGDYNSLTDEQKENYRALGVEIAKTESNLKGLKNELKETGGFNLDRLNNSLSGIRETTEKIVTNLVKFGTVLGGALTALGVSSIKEYADYEQLVGGVEAMFGGMQKGAEQITKIQNTAQNAWKDLTVSQNEYYRMFTSSYPLVKSSIKDENEAIEVTNRLLRLNSDLSNTFGYDITTASTAVNWALKGSFNYIDNLNIGIKGTKEGFLEAARNCGYVVDSVDDLKSSDILNVLETYASQYGVLGRTAEEAGSTIQGSTKMLKSSWSNLKLAISDDNADMEKAVNDFVDSAINASKNIVPRIRTAIDGIKKLFNSLVRDVFPKLKREIPELKPIINIFEWFIDHKNLVITAIKAIIGAFVVTKIVDFATKIRDVTKTLINFASGSVLGGVVAGITAVIGVVTILTDLLDTETEAEKQARLEREKHISILNDQAESWKNVQEAQQTQLNNSMTELDYYDNLYKELQSITDENGKVKDGYEARAKFITSQLSDALGTEIKMNGNVVESYGDVQKAIEETMKKKRADAIMDSQTQSYTEAKNKKAEALKNLQDLENDYLTYKEEYERRLNASESNGVIFRDIWKEREIQKRKEAYEAQLDLVNDYNYTIAQYEQNMVYAHEGAYDKIDTRSWESVKEYQNASDAHKAQLEGDIKNTKRDLELLNEAYAKTGDERYLKQIETGNRILQEQETELKKYISAFDGKKNEVNSAGANFITGFINGVNGKKGSLYTTLTNLGNNILSWFKNSLKEKSPSKATREMGQYLLEGISLGLKDEENSLLNQVDSLGNSIIDGFYSNTVNAMNGLGSMMSTSLNPTINPSVAYDLNYKIMADAMKEALQEVNVELDDREVGRFIDKTVSEEVFN